MKRIADLTIAILFASLVASCAQATSGPIEGKINPGDEIDGMVFTTVDEIDWEISLTFRCDFDSVDESDTSPTIPCFAAPGDRVFFGNCNGILYDTPQEAEKLWQDFKLDITFDEQAVNLPLFGYLDIEDEGYFEKKYLRLWNLVVENISPGIHNIQCKEELTTGETDIRTYVFTVSDQPESLPMLSSEAPHGINAYRSTQAKLDYLLYLPGDYGVDPEVKWPLLIYLHGMDRVNKSVNVLHNAYPLSALIDKDDFPFILVAPQGTGEYEFWAQDEMVGSVMALVDEIQSTLVVDGDRIYLTGESAGGNGTWEIGVRHPERFATLVPMMGYYGWPFTVPENICDIKDIPVWAFHGDADDVVPLEAEQSIVDALKACGGEVQFTVFPDVGHELEAQRVYAPELYSWLLEQRLGMPTTATATAVMPTATPTEETPIAAPTYAFMQVTSAEEVIGTWFVGMYYIRFDEAGTFRQAHALETLDSQPYAISSYDFDGTKMVTQEISVSGVPSCGNQTGSYELRLLENGNLQILVIEDRCTGRALDTAGEYRPVR